MHLKFKLIIDGILLRINVLYTFLRYRIKISRILKIKKRKSLSSDELKVINTFFSKYGFKNTSYKWHQFYNDASGIFHANYIPEALFYSKIEPALNCKICTPALLDKNIYSYLFKNVKQPVTIIKNINGFYFDKNDDVISKTEALKLCLNLNQMVIKPSLMSGSGKNVLLIKNETTKGIRKENLILKLFKKYDKDFIIQRRIEQNESLKRLNHSSVNTIRILSYLRHSEVVILSGIIRVGGPNEIADNAGEKTIGFGIDFNGIIHFGFDHFGHKFTNTSSGYLIKGFKVPKYNQIRKLASELHSKLPYFRLVSWDFTVDANNEIVLIEFNSKYQGINVHNLNNGPLFGEFTDEILGITQDYWKKSENWRSL